MSAARLALVVAALGSLLGATAGCDDLRNYEGSWFGPRVGGEAVRRGFDGDVTASLALAAVDRFALAGSLTTSDGRFEAAPIESLAPAEADVLGSTSFDGAPLRVYWAFAPATDGGDALAIIALYADERVELRVLRGAPAPLYGIFELRPRG